MRKRVVVVLMSIMTSAFVLAGCGSSVTEETVSEVEQESSTESEEERLAREQTEKEALEQAKLEEAEKAYEEGRKALYGLDGSDVDLEKAYDNFLKAADNGKADANFYLGVLADWYSYPEKDYAKAGEYYEKAGDNPYAKISLGGNYYYGQGRDEDKDKGVELFQEAIDSGCVDGNIGLASDARDKEDYELALELFEQVAESGTEQLYVASAMYNMGDMYRNGEGVEQDYEKALEWFTKAADLGNVAAMNNMGYMYKYGEGVEQDYEKALEWYTKSADLGNTPAMNSIGYLYYMGEGVEQDYEKALEWYTKSADLGNAVAISSIGNMYYNGDGVEQDFTKAIEWYEKALEIEPDNETYKKYLENAKVQLN